MDTQLIDNKTGEIVAADDAWERHRRIVALRNRLEETFLELGRELHVFHTGKQYETLGYASLEAYLADPEVDLRRTKAMQAMAVYRHYVLSLECPSDGLLNAGVAKAELLIPHTTKRNVNEWLEKAASLSRSDLRREIEEAFPKETPPLPSDKYRIVYADPPWQYGNTMPDYFIEQGNYYDLMTVLEICALPIRDLVADDAVLFLWVTSPILEESFQVIKAWGFEYKTSFVWDKVKHCMGHYNSVRHELLLVCTRGSCMPDEKTLFDSVVTEERPARHSQKPEIFRRFIDTLYPSGRRIELFARQQAEGWDVWGNEVSVS